MSKEKYQPELNPEDAEMESIVELAATRFRWMQEERMIQTGVMNNLANLGYADMRDLFAREDQSKIATVLNVSEELFFSRAHTSRTEFIDAVYEYQRGQRPKDS